MLGKVVKQAGGRGQPVSPASLSLHDRDNPQGWGCGLQRAIVLLPTTGSHSSGHLWDGGDAGPWSVHTNSICELKTSVARASEGPSCQPRTKVLGRKGLTRSPSSARAQESYISFPMTCGLEAGTWHNDHRQAIQV